MKQKVTRLFDSFKPSNYDLSLELDPEKMTFSGLVVIKGHKVGRPSQRLVLHQKGLKITGAKLIRHDKKGEQEFSVDRINSHNRYDELRLHCKTMLFPGQYSVTVSFEGRITDPMNGIYPCNFTENSKEQKLLATQFESHHAREVFPCIDEPEAKATFDLSLITPNDGLSVIANTPIKDKKTKDGKVETSFETTPVMSTYLLAFVHGNVGYKESKTARGTLVRVYATPENVAHTGFAVETAVKCLEFYEEYFGIPYPLEKCDMIALPDFASGAMENWGLITYREQCLFVDPNHTSLSTKQYVAMVIAHELAHQWFGNLVTMRWWTDLWLNEGFASWIEYLAVDKLFPEWDMWTQFIVDEQQPALKLDALDNTHPVEVPINHPDEIRSIFDAISYNKGASVIHMLHGYLGADDFRDGLRHYLTKHAYKNTDTMDLWAALEEKSGKPVKQFMHAWTSLPGFPLLSVDHTKDGINLKQHRFYLHQPDSPAIKHWPLPLLAKESDDRRLTAADMTVEPDDSAIALFNQGQSGFYRTMYDDETLKQLSSAVEDNSLSPLDRLGILADGFEVAKAGYTSVTDALSLLKAFKDEENSAVWDIIVNGLGEVRRVMDDETVRETIKPFVATITTKELSRLGWEERPSDSHFDKLLRPTILGLCVFAEVPSVVAECLKRFNEMKKPGDIPADLRGVIYSCAAREGDESTYERLLKMHSATSSSEERTILASALTGFKQPELIKRSLDLITTKTVRNQDAMYWVAYSLANHHAKHATWKWICDNWTWLHENLGSDLSFFMTPIYVARSFSDEEFIDVYKAFFNERTSPALERSIKQGLEMLTWQIAWKKRDLKNVKDFLKQPAA